jgi:hypothetical protein
MDDVIASLQRMRMTAFLQRLADSPVVPEDGTAYMLMGLAIGLMYAKRHPQPARDLLRVLDPPDFSTSLRWVANGSDELDPDEPVN